MAIVLSSDTMSLRTLTELADKQVKRAVEAVNGVGQVDLGGGRAREIHIVVDIEKLNGYKLTIEDVRNAIASENIECRRHRRQAPEILGTPGRVDAAGSSSSSRR
jgi:multidrug efflux pump subunit AcrB